MQSRPRPLYRFLALATALASAGCNSAGITLPASSSELAGTWIGSAKGITTTMTLGTAECSTTWGICTMHEAPATYKIDATGETVPFAIDVVWSSTSDISFSFVSTQIPGNSYREQFRGSLNGATLVGAYGGPLNIYSPYVPASAMDVLLSTSMTFNRQ